MKNKTVFRSATQQDIEKILNVVEKAFRIEKGSDKWENMKNLILKEPENWRVLLENGEIIGAAHIGKSWLKIGKSKILKGDVGEVSIPPEYQGKGYGTKLMKDVVEWMKKEGYDISRLGGLVKFYSRFGYHKFPRRYVEFFFPKEIKGGRNIFPFSKFFLSNKKDFTHIRPFQKKDYSAYINLYNQFNAERPGSPVLEIKKGNFPVKKDLLKVVYEENGKVLGYLFATKRKKKVSEFEPMMSFEIGGELKYRYVFEDLVLYILRIAYKEGIKSVTTRLPFDPRLIEIIKEVKVPFKLVELYEAGASNMIQIISLTSLFRHLLPELQYRLKNSLIEWNGTLEIDIGKEKIQLFIQKKRIKITKNKKPDWKIKLDEPILLKMILGMVSPSEITFRKLSYQKISLLQVLFPNLPTFSGAWG